MFEATKEEALTKALQLLLLFLPAANRRILHMLLKLMNKMMHNDDLVITDCVDKRQLVSHAMCHP